jgi:hypothetical protein
VPAGRGDDVIQGRGWEGAGVGEAVEGAADLFLDFFDGAVGTEGATCCLLPGGGDRARPPCRCPARSGGAKVWSEGASRHPTVTNGSDQGSAVVAFTFLSLLLMVPLVSFMRGRLLSRTAEI